MTQIKCDHGNTEISTVSSSHAMCPIRLHLACEDGTVYKMYVYSYSKKITLVEYFTET